MNPRFSTENMDSHFTAEEVDGIRKRVRQGSAGIDRAESKDYQGKEGLKQFFAEIRTEAHKEHSSERPGKAQP